MTRLDHSVDHLWFERVEDVPEELSWRLIVCLFIIGHVSPNLRELVDDLLIHFG